MCVFKFPRSNHNSLFSALWNLRQRLFFFGIFVAGVINRLIVGSLSGHFVLNVFEGAFLRRFGHFLSSTVFLGDYFVEVALEQSFYVGVFWGGINKFKTFKHLFEHFLLGVRLDEGAMQEGG